MNTAFPELSTRLNNVLLKLGLKTKADVIFAMNRGVFMSQGGQLIPKNYGTMAHLELVQWLGEGVNPAYRHIGKGRRFICPNCGHVCMPKTYAGRL